MPPTKQSDLFIRWTDTRGRWSIYQTDGPFTGDPIYILCWSPLTGGIGDEQEIDGGYDWQTLRELARSTDLIENAP
jgi:hypothetical protein